MIALQTYSQRDSRWGDEFLGFSKVSKIKDWGCLVTSYAMLATYYNKPTNPSEMNNLFKQTNSFVDKSYLISGNVLSRVYPEIEYRMTFWWDNVNVTDNHLLQIKEYTDRGQPVVLKLETLYGHYVLAIGWDNGIVIADPQDGKIRKISDRYGDPKKLISRVIIYEGRKITMAKLSKGVTVSTQNKYHPNIDLATVVEMSEDRDKTLCKATFPNGNVWEEWCNTADLIVPDLNPEIHQLREEVNRLLAEVNTLNIEVTKAKKYWEEWKEKAGNYQEEIKKIEGSLGAVEVIILQMLQLFNEE